MVVTVTSRKGKTVQGKVGGGGGRKIIMHEANTIHEAAKAIWGSDIQEETGSSEAFVTSYSSFPSFKKPVLSGMFA